MRCQGFLRFIVGEALDGDQDRLGGYAIGLAVFGRSEDFDPQTDPIVRVEAGRLRRRLEHYYLTEGALDTVLIDVPKGGYVPRFSFRVATDPTSEIPAVDQEIKIEPGPRRRRRPVALAALSLMLLVVLVLGSWWLAKSRLAGRPDDVGSAAPTGPTTLVVLPFDYTADADLHPFLADGLVEELIASLAALPGVEVIAVGSAQQVARNELTPKEVGRILQADYVVRGEIRQERARIRLTVSVIETSNSLVRMSKSYGEDLDNVLDLQAAIARNIAGSLATEMTPAFERRLTETQERDSEILALYHQAAALRDPPSATRVSPMCLPSAPGGV